MGASVVFSGVGVLRGRPPLAVIGVVLSVPFLFYLALTPRFEFAAPLVAVFYILAPVALTKGSRLGAAILATPFLVLAAYLAYLVITQR